MKWVQQKGWEAAHETPFLVLDTKNLSRELHKELHDSDVSNLPSR